MKKIVVDIETTVTVLDAKKKKLDLSPFNPNNKLVSVGWRFVEDTETHYVFFHHSELRQTDDVNKNREKLQNALNQANVFIAHNAKFDAMWLLECGFKIPDDVRCTMVREYVLQRGLKADLSLEGCTVRRGITKKKSELVDDYLAKGLTFYDIPYDTVEEYGRGDIQSCAELYVAQEKDYQKPENQGLIKTRDMSCEFTSVLIEMERNGVMIDKAELEAVYNEFSKEKSLLEIKINEIVSAVMGDTPINLNSPEQLSKVIYSREPKNKEQWIKLFNVGTNERGKPLKRPRMTPKEFKDAVVGNCKTIYRSKAIHCETCKGVGKIHKTKANGEPFKKATKCPNCYGQGFTLDYLNEIAGLKMMPSGVDDVASGGFGTDSETLEKLIVKAKVTKNDRAVELLTALIRVSALDTYINSFVKGIERGMQADGLLHAKFNQTITSTGRLSSTDPNLQNQPRGNTFPVRRVFISRWAKEGGSLCETDFSQLEFRGAGHLAHDERILEDIKNGKDIHSQTSKTLTDAGQETNRQDAKPHTFKPLYGGMSGTDAEQTYYRFFLDFYNGVGKWHEELQEEAIKTKKIKLPTGREYAFPHVERTRWGSASQKTQIVNWPVQGFATADIVPIALIYLFREYKKLKLRSLLCLTVHDSIASDVFPGEQKAVHELHKNLHKLAEKALEEYYGITMFVPLDSETKDGPNLLKMTKV